MAKQQEQRGAGRPPKSEEQLMVRINVTLPLATARMLRSRIPEKKRSKLINDLLLQHLGEEQKS